MTMKSRYHALVSKHLAIEKKIATELKRPLPDGFALQRLKRQKLMLRDQIESWERLVHAVRPYRTQTA